MDQQAESEISKNLAAEDSSDRESNAVENQTKKLQNMKPGHVG